jgi:hypothetical protein
MDIAISGNDGGKGAARMAEYRAYSVGLDGHFVASQALSCADDAEAIEKTKQLVNGRDIELWSRDRFIIRLVPKPK